MARADQVEARLRALLDDRPLSGEIARPRRLLAAMRHGVLTVSYTHLTLPTILRV